MGRAYLKSVPSLPESAELYDKANMDRYAELWIGDHPNGPAEIEIANDPQLAKVIDNNDFMKEHHGKDLEITELFKLNPERFLGKAYLDKFAKDNADLRTSMAFLLKVLSIDKALSIQAHPDKSLAEKLHAAHPEIYRDANHKPELAIAKEDGFIGLCGFLTPEKLRENLEQNRVLSEIFKYREGDVINAEFLKNCVHKLLFELDKNHELLEHYILKLVADIDAIDPEQRTDH